jgi:ABC-type lipoprotein export system ATPase subunit
VEAIVQADAITKAYQMGHRTLEVLRGVSVAIQPGETVAVIGPSGAGKSTLLHALGGLDQPSSGQVLFRGRDLYRLSPRDRTAIRARHVGFMFQAYHLLPELDVLENVLLPTMTMWEMRRQRTQHREKAESLLTAVGLAERMHHTPLELSGGEQQRVALARALMNDPELVLADEPTGNLDSVTGDQVLKCLFSLTRERRHTLVLVTHNDEIAATCDRIIHLKDGRLIPSSMA